jgi:hypothetical protein
MQKRKEKQSIPNNSVPHPDPQVFEPPGCGTIIICKDPDPDPGPSINKQKYCTVVFCNIL